MQRKEFLKIGSGATAGIFLSSFFKPAFGKTMLNDFFPFNKMRWPKLVVLDSEPPIGTKAVRYFIDNMQIAELTNLYATQTNTKPVWKTVVAPDWFKSGEQPFRVEADTPQGTVTLKDGKIIIPEPSQPQQSISLSGAWHFNAAEDLPSGSAEGKAPKAAGKNFDYSNWPSVIVPHSIGYVDQKWNKDKGILGVYRRSIDLKAPAKGEQIAIVLQSCYWMGRVFINGIEVGQTKGGYLPSRFDITDQVHEGKNEVSFITDNRFSTMGTFQRLHYYYWNWGGLLQEVSIERNPEVALIDMRAQGSMDGNLKLWLTAVNKTKKKEKHEISIEVHDPSGKKVFGPNNMHVLIPEVGGILESVNVKINNPKLWNPDTPLLYTVSVKSNHSTLTERTGFRDVKTKDGNLLVNGKVIEDLQGFDRHADYPGLGRTQPNGLPYQELKELHDKGFRIFRPAHYPTTPAELDAADELGFLVIEEINVTGLKGPQLASKEVKDFAAQQLTKMIHRDRSHPSIIAWSVGNENLTDAEGAVEYVRDTIHLGRSLDPTRLFLQVSNKGAKDKTFKYQDLVAVNFYAGWYSKKVISIVHYLDRVQPYAGNKPTLIMEYGAEAVIGRLGTGKGTEFYQSYIVDEHNRLLKGRKNFVGKLYWSSTEFWCRPDWSGGNPSPVPPFHVKGLQGYYREENKLAWRVMFSPVRLSFDKSELKETQFGGELKVPDKKSTITQTVIVKEINGKAAKGSLVVLPPIGFKPEKDKLSFELKPNESKSISFSLKGSLPDTLDSVNGYIKAVIDGDTEAQPLLLTLSEKKE